MKRDQTRALGGSTAVVPAWVGWAPALLGLLAVAFGLLLGAGCGKRGEAKITGSRSAPPVSLACVWQPGYTYHLRLDTEILTEIEDGDPDDNAGRHRVTYGQECLVRVANAQRGNNLDLEVEIISLEMERAKNEGVALSFNSEQGGETVDDLGYIPTLKKMVGGRLRFSVAPSGRIVRFEGISEWLNNALGIKPAPRTTTAARVKTLIQQNPPGPPGNSPSFEVAGEDIAFRRGELTLAPAGTNVQGAATRALAAAPVSVSRTPSSSNSNDAVGRTLRGFYNNELFRMLLEFRFLPSAAVRVGDEWKEAGETPFTGRSSRVKYDAQCRFTGWQMRASNNCARIDAKGKAAATNAQAKVSRKAKSGMDGTVWVNTELSFPVATVLDKESVFPGDKNTRMVGTSSVTTTSGPKYMRQHVIITLLKATPPEAAVTSETSVKPEGPTTGADSSP